MCEGGVRVPGRFALGGEVLEEGDEGGEGGLLGARIGVVGDDALEVGRVARHRVAPGGVPHQQVAQVLVGLDAVLPLLREQPLLQIHPLTLALILD
jgi:hypothetical protein